MIRAAMAAIGQVAKSVPFDKSGTDFTSSNVQDALTEIITTGLGIDTIIVTSTSEYDPSNASYALVTSMTSTPGAGTWLVLFSGGTEADTDADGAISIFNNGSQVTHSERRIYCEAAGLLGAVGSAAMGSLTMAIETVGDGEAIEVKAKKSAGTIKILNRCMILIRVKS